MKKLLLSLMAAFALTANAADVVTSLTFDDAESPALTAGSNASLDYTHAGVVGEAGQFLNIWGANNTNGATNIAITTTDMTEYAEWTLEFDFCGYSGCNKRTGTASLLDSNGNALFTITDKADWNNTMTVSDGNSITCYPCNKATRISANTGNVMTADLWYHITVVGAKGGVKLTAAQYNADGTLKDAAISKSVLSSTNASPATLAIAPGSCGAMGVDNLVLTGNNDVAQSYSYTVKYVCDGVDVKEALSSQDAEGTALSLSAADKAPVYVGTDKYIYVSDDSEGKVVTSDGKALVTVTFRKAEIFNYSIVSSLGGAVVTGSNFEGESITTGYPHYQLVEGQLNVAGTNNKEYNTTFTLDEDNKEVAITYAESKQDVVYYSEAEDIEGLTVTTFGNIGIRASKSLAAVAKADTKITTLEAGKYIITGGLFSSAKTPDYYVQFTAGSNNFSLHNVTCNASEASSEEITITKATDLMLVAEGMGDNNALDYIFIQKTGEYEAPKNTVAAGKYIAQVTIAEAEGVTAPADFTQYVGTHKYGMDLAGDEESMTISGLEILNNLAVEGDAVAYDATKKFTMNGKEFTICSVDGTKDAGSLAITKNEDGTITIEDFGFKRGAKFAGTAKNIVAKLQENKETEANITFEDVDLAGATYYKGEDEAGLVSTATDYNFMNYYKDYGTSTAWNGFAVSATRGDNFVGNYGDDTQFNSCMAGGMESAQFAVGYYSEYNAAYDEQYPEIYATKNMKPEYAYITNTASAYISMTQGDGYAAAFGADDFLKLTITGMTSDEEETGKVEFLLGNGTDIVKEWTKVDLTPLGTCASIRFTMSCSQTDWGFMKTPAYFAIDNLKIELTDDEPTAVAGVAEAKAAAKTVKTVKNGKIVIVKDGVEYNAAGSRVK